MSLVEKLTERPVAADPAGIAADWARACVLLHDQAASIDREAPHHDGAEALRRERLGKVFNDPDMRVLLLDGETVGFYCINVSDEVHVRHLSVDAAFQGQGIGHHILERALGIAHDRQLPLTVSVPKDAEAVSFLIKAGFEVCGSRDQYFGDVEQDCVHDLDMRSREAETYRYPAHFNEPEPRHSKRGPSFGFGPL